MTDRGLQEAIRAVGGVTELARPHGMSVNAISKHLFVLEQAGLIRRAQNGRVQTCVLEAAPMATAEDWIAFYRGFWTDRIDRLADYVEGEED